MVSFALWCKGCAGEARLAPTVTVPPEEASDVRAEYLAVGAAHRKTYANHSVYLVVRSTEERPL